MSSSHNRALYKCLITKYDAKELNYPLFEIQIIHTVMCYQNQITSNEHHNTYSYQVISINNNSLLHYTAGMHYNNMERRTVFNAQCIH